MRNLFSGESIVSKTRQRGKKTLLRDQQGMALLITVVTVSLLVAITLQYHKSTWQQFLVSNNYKVGHQLKAIADSGVNIALALLRLDGEENQSDSLLDSWAMIDQEKFEDLFSSGSLQVKVIDMSGRLQVNGLVQKSGGDENNTENEIRRIFLELLQSGFFPIEDETEAQSIVDALVDWIDEDDDESDFGAESGYYQSLKTPYNTRNGPVRSLEELLLIKGISRALLFGTEGKPGLADYLTVNGDDGKMNISTAPLLVIKSMDPLITDDLLAKLAVYRSEKDNEESLTNIGWYKEVDGWPGDIVLNQYLLTTSSTYFKIIATGVFDTLSRSVVALAERSDGEVKLIGKQTE